MEMLEQVDSMNVSDEVICLLDLLLLWTIFSYDQIMIIIVFCYGEASAVFRLKNSFDLVHFLCGKVDSLGRVSVLPKNVNKYGHLLQCFALWLTMGG